MISLRAAALASVALVAALVPAPAVAKITKVKSIATVTSASGAPVGGWKLKTKLARGTKVVSVSGAKANKKKGQVTLTPTGAKTRKVTLLVKGSKRPSGWKVGAIGCAAKSAGRKGRTALQKVTCVLGVPGGDEAGDSWFRFSPYADLSLPATPDLNTVMAETGVSHFTLGFVVAGPNGACDPTWGGFGAYPASGTSPYKKGEFDTLKAAGGDVVASFGGQTGNELAIGCTNVAELTSAYQSVIDAYGINHVDFDVEGAATSKTDANDRRNKAITQLQQNAAAAGKTLWVSFTLSTLPTGIDDESAAVLGNAISNGVDISLVNVMAMNYGDANAPDGDSKMGDYAVQAGNAIIARLATLYPSLDAAQVRRKAGVTSLIGVNDVNTEVFQLADRQKVVDWATEQHIGMLSMWSVARDKQCPGSPQPSTIQPDCSSITQQPWDFAKKLADFVG